MQSFIRTLDVITRHCSSPPLHPQRGIPDLGTCSCWPTCQYPGWCPANHLRTHPVYSVTHSFIPAFIQSFISALVCSLSSIRPSISLRDGAQYSKGDKVAHMSRPLQPLHSGNVRHWFRLWSVLGAKLNIVLHQRRFLFLVPPFHAHAFYFGESCPLFEVDRWNWQPNFPHDKFSGFAAITPSHNKVTIQ